MEEKMKELNSKITKFFTNENYKKKILFALEFEHREVQKDLKKILEKRYNKK